MADRNFRVGADVGGTFTDIVFLEDDGTVHVRKCPSTPEDYARGILDGVLTLLEELGGRPDQIREVVHATTVATNAVLEGKGARTSLVTTEGFRDVLELGRLRVPELYNLNYEKPVPLVPRRRRHEVAERVGPGGDVVRVLDEEGVAEAAARIRADGARAVAVSFLHAYANPEHEARTGDLLRRLLGEEVYVSLSSEVLPEVREYERTSTVVVNAYLGPVVRDYLRSLSARLRAAGVAAPLQIMQSSGGVMGAEAAIARPASIIESGPAAGVIAAASIGAFGGYRDLITIDMGGTTAKAAMVEAGEPARTTEYEVGAGINVSSKLVKGGGHAVKMPFIDVSEIGAGGGSIVRVDGGGLIQVGPDSAGAVPGPACYGAGGRSPTLTDALLVLGFLNPHRLAGGAVRLEPERAHEALRRDVCGPAGLAGREAAHGVYAIAATTMTRAVKAVSTYRGRDPRDFTLFAFGGNGPLMACEIAALLDMPRIVVPPTPGVFSALGLLYSATRHELMRTLLRPVADLAPEELEGAYAALEGRARAGLVADGYPADDVVLTRQADLRYAGQAYELTVPLKTAADGLPDLSALVAAFHAEHERTYGHASAGDPVELVNLRVLAGLAGEDVRYAPPGGRPPGGEGGAREVYFGPRHGVRMTPVIARGDLVGGRRAGPLIVEEYDATCVVQPGCAALLDGAGNILIEREIA